MPAILHRPIRRGAAVFALAALSTLFSHPAAGAASPLESHLAASTLAPAEYVLSRLADHRIVILGESHWARADVELVRSLVPELRRRRVSLAMEFFPAELQPRIDALVSGADWDPALANEVMRLADWPYIQYREILRAAWETNRAASSDPPFRIVALAAPRDFRERRIDYDGTMAQRVVEALEHGHERVLVYCGMHHAFTRYLQVDRRSGGRAVQFMTRLGNLLWRQYGEGVFLIALHKAEWCGPGEEATTVSCAPFGGALDCAAAALGRPLAFDVTGSPVAEMKFPSTSFYTFGYPYLRFVDYADGYVLLRTLDRLEQVDLIPLEELAPEDARDPAKAAAWKKRQDVLAHPLDRPGYRNLRDLRARCAPKPAAP